MDQTRDSALALFEEAAEGPLIHAVARYCLDDNNQSAEIAFIVRESKQRLGMANILVTELISIARDRGLESVWAQVLRENTGAIDLLEQLRFKKTGVDEGNIILRLDLKKAAPAKGVKKRPTKKS